MTTADLFTGWDWGDPAGLDAKTDEFMNGFTGCEQLTTLAATPPFSRQDLGAIGVTGIEFAALRTRHDAGIGADMMTLRGADQATEPGTIYQVDGREYFTQLDIRQPLPFETDSVEWAYAEHLIEHVSLTEGIGWLAEVRRILAPGGLLRLTTPDLAKYVDGYREDDAFYAKHRRRVRYAMPGAPPMPKRKAFMFNQIFYLYGHRWIYDIDELTFAVGQAGFAESAVSTCGFRTGSRQDVADLDQTVRNDETMYVEVTA